MERTGPESLMLMAAAPIFRRASRGGLPLWEAPAEIDRAAPTLLAAVPAAVAPARPERARRLLAWLQVAHVGAPPERL